MQAFTINPKANPVYSLRQERSKLELDMLNQNHEHNLYVKYQEIQSKLAQSKELDLLLDPRD